MQEIKTYPVKHPLLRRNIRFFWEISSDNMSLDHKLIPQRNVTLRFNLNDTQHRICQSGYDTLLEDSYFSGLHDHFTSTTLKLTGKVHIIGISFFPEGFYPFIKVPMSEFKNSVPGASEAGFALARIISEKLKDARDTAARLEIIETEFMKLLVNGSEAPGIPADL